uniref:ATP synthase subunit b n=1 Tax=Equus asinus TaxID=9793 RepID=A0A9L0IXG8_EQUAS
PEYGGKVLLGPIPQEFFQNMLKKKMAQLQEVKQASIKHIQAATDLEKSQQALVQKLHYLFDLQRNSIAMASEGTH